jgi:hypothetical protein
MTGWPFVMHSRQISHSKRWPFAAARTQDSVRKRMPSHSPSSTHLPISPSISVFEDVDTFKKAKTLTSHPVIFSKYIFDEFIDAMQKFLTCNEILEELVIEGLPFTARYMPMLVNVIRTNKSIKSLSFSRCNIGDDGCEILCAHIKHMPNIETLNLSSCELTPKGADFVMKYIKLQRIHHFSDAWASTLRYQNGEYSMGGIQKIVLNNNPLIGDEGLKEITSELLEDTWVKEIEMQNCGITQAGAEYIINCLATNKSIKNFDVTNNTKLPETCMRQILMHFHGSDSSSFTSSSSLDSGSSENRLTRAQLVERCRLLEVRFELEISRRKEYEELNERLHKKAVESITTAEKYKQEAEKVRVPEGFTLMKNDYLEEIISEKIEAKQAVNLRRHKRMILKKQRAAQKLKMRAIKLLSAQSFKTPPPSIASTPELVTSATQTPIVSRAQAMRRLSSKKSEQKRPPFYEKNIGDYFHNKEISANNDGYAGSVSEHSLSSCNDVIEFLFSKKNKDSPDCKKSLQNVITN